MILLLPLQDLEAVKMYKLILIQFVPVLQGIIKNEELLDHSDTYSSLINFQRAFIGLIKTLKSAEEVGDAFYYIFRAFFFFFVV